MEGDMKLTFYGADRTVTGSCHCVDACGKRILIDCGMFQGGADKENEMLRFAPNLVDYVIVTHAHIDHSGRIPLLVKHGFAGRIVTTRLTAELMDIMLKDSAHIQESDAMWANQKGKRAGREPVEPLYTIMDAEKAMEFVETHDYDEEITLCDGVRIKFTDAGHLLGSAIVEMWITEDGVTKKLVFSGDLGNKNQAVIRDPQPVEKADYVIMESTYGNRLHKEYDNYVEGLAQVIDETFSKGGNVIIPSFAVGRAQELLYFIREMKERGLVKNHPDFQVWLDSPLALEATKIYSGDLTGYIDEEAMEVVASGKNMFGFDGLRLSRTSDESKALNEDPNPKVIISASGMCDAGRIRHHLKHNLWRPECSIVFVGYQAEGTLGRALLNGVKNVKMFGEEIIVRADIVRFKGLSGHADLEGLTKWAEAFWPKPEHVFVVHGDLESTENFTKVLSEKGIPAHAPDYEEEYDLIENKILRHGKPMAVRKKAADGAVESPAFLRLVAAGKQLCEVILKCRGMANKELAKFTDQIKALIAKWDR
jgi:metallo-beta-lactamase family protein